MSRIQILNPGLINKIAAGEVVERPASVVKELVENAIDARSTSIDVEIRGGGIDYIRVTDNGIGLKEDELELAFTRHATSKLRSEEDLWQIGTMGFRGEALPSIASVARVEMASCSEEGPGCAILINGGESDGARPAAAAPGTNLTVKDLFFNTPARRKFLKTKVTEGNQVMDWMVRLAFSHPEIRFSFSNEQRRIFITEGNGDLRGTVTAVWGRDFSDRLVEIDGQNTAGRIYGLIGSPDFTRKNRRSQLLFVNRRPVRNPLLSTAVEEGFRGFLVSGERPVCVLFIEVDPETVDVNVHPQKTEVRFRDEQAIFGLIRNTVREALYGLANRGLAVDPTTLESNVAEVRSSDYRPGENHDMAEKLFGPGHEWRGPVRDTFKPSSWAGSAGRERPAGNTSDRIPAWMETRQESREEPGLTFRVFGQWQDSYILCQVGDRLEIIDQHAAHERLLYNRLNTDAKIDRQGLLVPVALEMEPAMIDRVLKRSDLLTQLGYIVDTLSERSLVVREVPAVVAGHEIETLVEILDEIEDNREPEFFLNESRKMMACKAAIKAGQRIGPVEMERLVADWLATEDRHHCPHGRPVSLVYTADDVARLLKR